MTMMMKGLVECEFGYRCHTFSTIRKNSTTLLQHTCVVQRTVSNRRVAVPSHRPASLSDFA